MINETIVQNLSTEQFVDLASTSLIIPLLGIFFVLYSLIFLSTGLIFVKRSKEKFVKIWFISLGLGIALLVLLVILCMFFPNSLIKFANIIK